MNPIDLATGHKLPADAIIRVLYIANTVHIYNIPPLASTKGHISASWTSDPGRHIFSARLRIVETSYEKAGGSDFVKVDVLLEDPASGELFAAAPYTAPTVVEAALDSSRFFAVRVQDPSGRKAMLGAGFEERSEAFDFSVALQDARKCLGMEGRDANAQALGGGGGGRSSGPGGKSAAAIEKQDYSLKEGETITIKWGAKAKKQSHRQETEKSATGDISGFSLPPPPGPSSSSSFLPPPPRAEDVRHLQKQAAKDLGFDDGEFDEFA